MKKKKLLKKKKNNTNDKPKLQKIKETQLWD